jgi:hypothetical protein
MSLKYISLGGWCGTTIAFERLGSRTEALPFDYVRSTFSGAIECIDNNFTTFFPKDIDKCIPVTFGLDKVYRGRNITFIHHNITDITTREAFERRFKRFDELLKNAGEKIVFLRVIVSDDPQDEINIQDKFHEVIKNKYPQLNYILCLLIMACDKSEHVLTLNDKTLVFTLSSAGDIEAVYTPLLSYIDKNHQDFPQLKDPKIFNKYSYNYNVLGDIPLHDPDN